MGNLSAFMRNEFKSDNIVEIPGFERFKDEKGKAIPFKVKVLSFKEIEKIRSYHRTERTAIDKKTRKPLVDNGRIVKEFITDNNAATNNIIVEALVYPNLKDKELMKFYEIEDVLEMPYAVFYQNEYYELLKQILAVLHITEPDDDDNDESDGIEEAKN